ncbi:MAG: adenine phosphoribosyltransferase [Candidatus Magasanikbacteria bacterium]|nr:adenine phosphoribosyltransferase [Candidatus Magasanikbacteria bacterium]
MWENLKQKIVQINDWPRPGIVCYDIAPLLKDAAMFKEIIEQLAQPYQGQKIDLVVGIEARGFVIASALAYRLGVGMAMIRKKNKLPPPTVMQEYSYEYAAQIIEMQEGAITPGQRVIIVDDTLATGGTMAAAVKLVKKLGGEIVGLSFIVEMTPMAGRERLRGCTIHSLVTFD